jgi:hypothetical protein
VVEVLDGYPDKFPEQTQFAPAAMYRVLYAQAQLGQQQAVREKLAKMLQLYPSDKWTGLAATESYKVLKQRYEAEADPQKKPALLREMAENLEVYNKTAATPSFPNMRTESRHWKDLGELDKTKAVLERMITVFKDDPAAAEDLEKFVKPDLGEVHLLQDDAQAATEILKPLMAGDAKVRASRDTAYNYAISVTGWLTFDETSKTVREHLGSGTNTKDFEAALEPVNQLADATEKWTADWYRYKAAQIYGYLRWAQHDGNRLDTAKNLMGYMATQLGAQQYKHEHMPEHLRQIYLWLASKLR